MLPESKNIQTLADNVRILDARTQALDIEIPEHTASDAGKVLTVDSEGDLEWALTIPEYSDSDDGKILAVDSSGDLEWKEEYSYTPPAYSETEVNTGQKWIDGKDIYCKVVRFTTNSTSSALSIGAVSLETLIETNTIVTTAGNQISSFNCYSYYSSNGYMYNIASSEGSQSKAAICIIRYTKPDPAPEPENLTKKKGAKK